MAERSKVAEAYAEVSADTSKLRSTMTSGQIPNFLKSGMSSIISGIGAGIGIGIGMSILHGIQKVVGEGIHSAFNLDKSQSRVEGMLLATGHAAGWTKDQLKAMQDEYSESLGFTRNEIAGAQAELLKFPNIKGQQFKGALEAAMDLARVMGTDLPSAAKELAEALDDPEKVAEGSLERYGILLTQQEKNFIRLKVAARDYAGAQNAVLQHFGRFNNAATDFAQRPAGQLERFHAAWERFSEELGKAFLPGLTVVLDFLTDMLRIGQAVFSDLSGAADIAWKAIKLGVQVMWDAFKNFFDGIFQIGKGAFMALVEGAIEAGNQVRKVLMGGSIIDAASAVGAVMAKEFTDGLAKGLFHGESDAAKQLAKELKEATDAFARKHGLNQEGDKDRVNRIARPDREPTPYINKKPFGFEFTGLEEMWKKIQEQLVPNEQIELQKAGVKAAEQAVEQQKQINGNLQEINKNVKGMGGQAKFAP